MPNPYLVGSNQGTTASLGFHPSAVTAAGDVLVVTVYTPAAVTAVKDTQSNSYIPVSAGSGFAQFVTAGKTTALALTDTITVTLASSLAVNAVAVGVPGVHFGGVDAAVIATGSGTAASVSTGALGCATGEVVIAAVGNQTGAATTWGAGFTSLGNSHGSLTQALNVAWGSASGSASVTASATIASSTWTAGAVTLQVASYVGNAPVPPSQLAGTVAASADMNTYAQACQFLLRRPMVIARAASTGSGQAMTANTPAAVQWASVLRDTDGFWSPANSTRLTVQTKGIYRARFVVPFTVAGANLGAWVRVTTGANNPAGAGLTQNSWYAWAGSGNSINGCVPGGGVILSVLYPLDYVEIFANLLNAGNLAPTPQPASCSLVLRST